MANVKQLRLRIKSIKSTKKITKAMQMVSAAKLRRSKAALDNFGEYHNAVAEAIHQALHAGEELSNKAKAALGIHSSHVRTKLLIAIGSDRGLCGGFNQNVFRLLRNDVERYIANGVRFRIIVIGKKPSVLINAHYKNHVMKTYDNLECSTEFLTNLSSEILEMLDHSLDSKNICSCDVYFSSFKNTVTQIAECKQILPIEHKKSHITENSVHDIEGKNVIDLLLKMHIIAQLNYAILDSRASEEASRTTAMDNATRNAEDMMDKLTLIMNRSRQAMITKELIEIISGAEAI